MEQSDILEQHFNWDKLFDERYHCNYCSYNTQLANKAANHFAKKHQDQVVDLPGQVPDPEQDHWQKEIELENLETEE